MAKLSLKPSLLIVVCGAVVLSFFLQEVPVKAAPVLPSSFYGEVRVNSGFVPIGTVVRALINGQVYSEGLSQEYNGASVFTLDVPGDDLSTPAIEGGVEGDIVQFGVGGVLAEQTRTWQSGTNIQVELTAFSSDPIDPPEPTLTPMPTQTAIPTATLAPTLVKTAQTTQTPSPPVQSDPRTPVASQQATATSFSQKGEQVSAPSTPEIISEAETLKEPDPTLISTESTSNTSSTLFIAAIGAVLIAGSALWAARVRSNRK